MKTFHRVVDPSHSWLKVPVAELERLGIADKITSYSYIRNGMAYLEEDVDMPTFLDARNSVNEPVQIMEFVRQRQSRIRNYDAYPSTVAVDTTDAEDDGAIPFEPAEEAELTA
jgi:hypothetical protein